MDFDGCFCTIIVLAMSASLLCLKAVNDVDPRRRQGLVFPISDAMVRLLVGLESLRIPL
jgi:hypothetical protein